MNPKSWHFSNAKLMQKGCNYSVITFLINEREIQATNLYSKCRQFVSIDLNRNARALALLRFPQVGRWGEKNLWIEKVPPGPFIPIPGYLLSLLTKREHKQLTNYLTPTADDQSGTELRECLGVQPAGQERHGCWSRNPQSPESHEDPWTGRTSQV